MEKIVIAVVLVLSNIFTTLAIDTEKLIKNFSGTDWLTILQAKQELENMEEIALPQVVELLDQDKIVKVLNTGDLIYPGATKFYGHGTIVDYEIDNLAVRAGWLLEEITFQNFGFSLIHDRDENLLSNLENNFKEFFNEAYIKKIKNMSADQLRSEIKKLAIRKAKNWWLNESTDWNRLNGIIDALHSDDNRRQILALKYLKAGETNCKGLTIETYLDELKGRITYLAKSKISRISEQSIFILNDSDFEFIRIKNK